MAVRFATLASLALMMAACAGAFDPGSQVFRCSSHTDCSTGFTCDPARRVCLQAAGGLTDTGGGSLPDFGPGGDPGFPGLDPGGPTFDPGGSWDPGGGGWDPGGVPWDDLPSAPDVFPDDSNHTDEDWYGELPPTCGDGACNGGEDTWTCPQDCEVYYDEYCNGEDDDHDGYTDEGTTEAGGHCDDGNPCTRDYCHGVSQCSNVPEPTCTSVVPIRTYCQSCSNSSECKGEKEACAFEGGINFCAPSCAGSHSQDCPPGSFCGTDRLGDRVCLVSSGECCYGPHCRTCAYSADCLGHGKCESGHCRCTTDADCTGKATGMLCNTNTSRCVPAPCAACAFPNPSCSYIDGGYRCTECSQDQQEKCQANQQKCDVDTGYCVAAP